ncbi:bacteriocin immunity protein [Tuwongella immobilis]|uniref:Colicin immunity protein:: Colicin_Pyocin n=1 Tax=Tuwongella immobilis TaxID=692036 RepID=A0A6C2YJ04_9BACT|nr:bacteriocin immunity protein [Tuwongella immobilis]VIP01065.1 colicin immunity protein : : Colicin_Pyocin [Tuwongella immobilis]VTR97555.1 colicin immunity protein : : Colicin_Pyocin [Tuwongella immobilis]
MIRETPGRQELIDLVDEYRDPSSRGRREPLAERLTGHLPGTDVLNLCQSDLPSETIVDFCLGFEGAKKVLDRAGMLELVKSIRSPQLTSEADDMLMLETFIFNCRHPAGTDLIYYPDEVFGEGVTATDEMIVDRALAGS